MYLWPLIESPEKFSHPDSRSKILSLLITELCYSPTPGAIIGDSVLVSRSRTAHKSTHDVQTIPGFNNENKTKNYKITGLTILVLFALCLLKNLSISQYSSVSYYNFTCQSSETKCDIPL